MIRVYAWNEVDFSGNGLAALLNASEVCVERAVNGDCTLSFKLPPYDRVWKYVKEEAVVKLEGQCYRIKTINGDQVTAYPIYQDSCGYHLQSTGEYIGVSGYSILGHIFEGIEEINVLDANTVSGLGLEAICGNSEEDKIDFFEQSKVTPVGALKYLQEQLDKYNIHNELYFDNKNIALVKKLGSDKGARIDLRFNAASIKPTRDTTGLITKLYPYGSGDMHIGSVTAAGYYNADGTVADKENYCYRILNDGDQFIVSPYVDNYPVHEGYMSFDDIDDPKELLKMAALQFESSNPERIDVPKYTVEVSDLVKIGIPIALGDIVEVNDPQFKIKTKQRVVSEKHYPFEPQKDTVTVGQPEVTILDMFGGAITKTAAMMTDGGKVKSSWLENIKSAYRTQINADFNTSEKSGRSTVIHEYGDIWVNPNDNNQALAIIGGRLAIANGRDEDSGDWNWTAFGDWSGFTADKLVGGTIYTQLIKLMGDGAKMEIDNNMITFKETAEGNGVTTMKVRACWGWDAETEQYVFEMYDNNGNRTMYLDNEGNLRMLGILDTRKEDENACGYLIEGSSITGHKSDGIGGYKNHGLYVTENNYGSHLSLCVDGKEHFHARAFNTSDGTAVVDLAVNNSGITEEDPDNDSWTFLRAFEGDAAASVKMYGSWNVDSCTLRTSNYTGDSNFDGREGYNATGKTTSFLVKSSRNGTEFFYRLYFKNGILMKIIEE